MKREPENIFEPSPLRSLEEPGDLLNSHRLRLLNVGLVLFLRRYHAAHRIFYNLVSVERQFDDHSERPMRLQERRRAELSLAQFCIKSLDVAGRKIDEADLAERWTNVQVDGVLVNPERR